MARDIAWNVTDGSAHLDAALADTEGDFANAKAQAQEDDAEAFAVAAEAQAQEDREQTLEKSILETTKKAYIQLVVISFNYKNNTRVLFIRFLLCFEFQS